MAAAQRLHAALEHTHHHGQHPELPLALQEEGKDGNAGIGRNAHRDQSLGFIFLAQAAKDQRRRESHDLSDQQRQQQAGGIQPQCRAVGSGHINDGIHAVDVAEEGQQEPEHLLVLRQMLQGLPDAHKALTDGVLLHLHIVDLAVFFQQRQGDHQPPHGGNDQRDGQRSHLTKPHRTAAQHQRQTDHKGHAAADIAPRVPAGGYHVHPLRGGHIAQHGVVEHQTAGVADLGNDKNDQKGQPCARQAHGAAADDAHEKAEHEDGLFKALGVRQRAQNGAQNGGDHRDDGTCVAPVGQIVHLAHPTGLGQRIEEDGHQRGNHQHKGRVAHIV